MAMEGNYYEILDVPKDANAEIIREAYKKMAIKWHPDKNMDNKDEADARFKEIAQAYQVLSDNDRRLRYDRSHNSDGDEYDNSDDSLDDYFGFFMTPDILFQHIFRQFSQDMQFSRQRMKSQSAKEDRHRNADCREHRCEHCCFNNESNTKPSTKLNNKPTTTSRMVNGKRWITQKYYEDGKEIIIRHEDGELVSKHIDGVAQLLKEVKKKI